MPVLSRTPLVALAIAILLAVGHDTAHAVTVDPNAAGESVPSVVPGAHPRDASSPHLPRFEVQISYVANLVHWIDNLAGSSQGKTIQAYREYWQRRFGAPDQEELEILRSWTRLRYKAVDLPEAAILNPSGCLPQREEKPDWRQTFLLRSYEADSVEAFVGSMAELSAEERSTLRRVIDRFRPKFDEAWKDTDYLKRFERKLTPFLDESGLRSYLGEVAAFFGVDPDAHPPGKIELMALPQEGATHAQADSRYLMIEIRPGDGPADQIQVIAHETSHYLWHQLDPARNDLLARQVHAAGRGGSIIWNLLREALPTALGQGLADSRLRPSRFSTRSPWYHIEEIDRFAKEIFPVVRDAFRNRESLQGKVMDDIARAGETSKVVQGASPAEYLVEAFFAVGEGMTAPYLSIREKTPIRAARQFAAADPNGASFAQRYECLSGVVLLGPEDLKGASSLPAPVDPPQGPRGGIVAVRRPAGGIIFYLLAATTEDVGRLAPAFLGLRTRPDEPVLLGQAPSAAPGGN